MAAKTLKAAKDGEVGAGDRIKDRIGGAEGVVVCVPAARGEATIRRSNRPRRTLGAGAMTWPPGRNLLGRSFYQRQTPELPDAPQDPEDAAMAACLKRHAPESVERPVIGWTWRPHVPGSCQLAYDIRTALERGGVVDDPRRRGTHEE